MSALSVLLRFLPALLALAAWTWGALFWRPVLGWAGLRNIPLGLGDGAMPVLALVNPILVMAVCVWAHKEIMLRRSAVYAAMIGTAVTSGLTLMPDLAFGSFLLVFDEPRILAMVFSGLAVAVACCILGPDPFARTPPAVTRAQSDNHGHADWLSMTAARRRFSGPDDIYGGIVVGEAYRVDQDPGTREPDGLPLQFDPRDETTWGKGGTAPLLIDPCQLGSTHGIIFAGSGLFKTTSVAVPTLLHWTGSAVVLDPSRELGPMLTRARQRMGQRVITLDPADPQAGAFNALDWIDPRDALPQPKIEAVVSWICGEKAREGSTADFFQDLGNALIGVAIADTVWNPKLRPEQRTLKRVRAMLVRPEPELRRILKHIHVTSTSQLARDLAGSLMDVADVTFSGICSNANKVTRWLSTPGFADLVSGRSFRASDLCAGRMTVFVQIPLEVLKDTPALARVIIGALLNAVYQADGRVQGRVLYLLDEAARLNRMAALETARDAGRKYRLTLLLLYQSVGQLVEQWGEAGRSSWYASTSWQAYAGVQDPSTTQELAQRCGGFGAEAMSRGTTRGYTEQAGRGSASTSRSETRSELRRNLIEPAEILQDLRYDEVIVIQVGSRPLRCGRAIFFRRAEMLDQVDSSRFQ